MTDNEYTLELLEYQVPLFTTERPYLVFLAATGTGKTYTIPRWLMSKMLEHPGEEWVVCAPTIGMLERNPVKYIIKHLKECGYKETNRRDRASEKTYYFNRSSKNMHMIFPMGTVYFITAGKYDLIQGLFPKGVIGDEAGLYPDKWWNTIVQRLAFKRGQALLATTWYTLNYLDDIHEKCEEGDPDYLYINPTSYDNPHYPLEAIEHARRNMPRWLFEKMFLAKKPNRGANQLFNITNVKYCMEDIKEAEYQDELLENVLTVDCARFGDDMSTLVDWVGYEQVRYRPKRETEIPKNSETELAGIIIKHIDLMIEQGVIKEKTDVHIIMDTTGIGAGAHDSLYDQEYWVTGVHFASAASEPEKYANVRTEMAFLFEEATRNHLVKLQNDHDLRKQCRAITFTYDQKGRPILHKKEEIKKNWTANLRTISTPWGSDSIESLKRGE